ncbi:hypothetical protein B2J77_12160 [Pseudomonas parafulva]|uniref:Uncharacterized protein n=1 Tax=Pseudomonas parafulva TaxID=157782 RepID=A0AAJ0LPL3_9PSED|nr:hypothetical protein B2J77_12160 [Pseudomonas parafulva]KTT19884.1 hypothetical protein NS96R_01780 [Pseudomonas parafulva]
MGLLRVCSRQRIAKGERSCQSARPAPRTQDAKLQYQGGAQILGPLCGPSQQQVAGLNFRKAQRMQQNDPIA